MNSASMKAYLKRNYHYYILLLLPAAYFVVFRYGPILGNILAFRKYVPGGSMFGAEWVGLKYFRMFLNDPSFWVAFKNTFILSTLNLLFIFPLPILFALLTNEMINGKVRRVIQTISYFPNFLSVVVIVGMLKELLSPSNGIVNAILGHFGFEPIYFVNEPEWFRAIYIGSDVWQFMGWNAIIYTATSYSIF